MKARAGFPSGLSSMDSEARLDHLARDDDLARVADIASPDDSCGNVSACDDGPSIQDHVRSEYVVQVDLIDMPFFARARYFEDLCHEGAPAALIHVEDFCQRNRDRFSLLIVLHEAVVHVVPPFSHDGMARQLVSGVVLGEFLKGEQGLRVLVVVDGVVADTGPSQRLDQIRPDLIVPSLVFCDVTAG